MDFSQNVNHNCAHSRPKKCDFNSSCTEAPKACPVQTSKRNDNAKDCCNADVADDDQLRCEIDELRIQLENLEEKIELSAQNHNNCHDELLKDYCELSQEYERTSDGIVKVRTENECSQNAINSKTTTKNDITNEIEQIKLWLCQYEECNNNLKIKIQKTQERTEQSERELADKEDAIACKTADERRSRDKLSEAERVICRETAALDELRRRLAEHGRAAAALAGARRDADARLAAQRETGPAQQHAADQCADAARARLDGARAALADWRGRREAADRTYREALADSDRRTCGARAELKRLGDERGRLAGRLADAANGLDAAACDGRHLAERVRERAALLAARRADVDAAERRASGERDRLEAARARRDADAKATEDEATVAVQRLVAVERELDALGRAHDRGERRIREAAAADDDGDDDRRRRRR